MLCYRHLPICQFITAIIFIIDQINKKTEANSDCCVCVTDPFVPEATEIWNQRQKKSWLLSNKQLGVDCCWTLHHTHRLGLDGPYVKSRRE